MWNREGVALSSEIPPTFWQSWPFKLLIALAAMALLWLAYSLRLRAVAARVRDRMAERLGERERISRLQGISRSGIGAHEPGNGRYSRRFATECVSF